ncbi:MAG: hypothetical protein L6R37_002453 [Teloschistes peruensis]|nr:MAG: hypothetical protein L6R37_002453 [Teloschistes peruensis]
MAHPSVARRWHPQVLQQLEHLYRYGTEIEQTSSDVWLCADENVPSTPILNRSKFLSAEDPSLYPSSVRSSKHSSRKPSPDIVTPIPKHYRAPPAFTQKLDFLEDINIDSRSDAQDEDNEDSDSSDKENQDPVEQIPRLSFDIAKEILTVDEFSIQAKTVEPGPPPEILPRSRTSKSLKRWMSHLRPQTSKQKKTLVRRAQRWPLDESPIEWRTTDTDVMSSRRSGHRKSRSKSSTGLVENVKTVLMERSAGTATPRQPRRSNLFSKSNRGSKASEDEPRSSNDQPVGLKSTLDTTALARATQRQKILEELIESEASYVADLKVLIHAYFTFLGSAPNVSQRMSMQIHENVAEILELHEDLLCQFQHVIKGAGATPAIMHHDTPRQPKQHGRRSVDGHRIAAAVAGLVHTARNSVDMARPAHSKVPPTQAETSKVLDIAEIFGKAMNRFTAYEEYGAKYDLMTRDLAQTSKSISNWHAFERSIEALANSLASSGASDEPARKGLSFGDLLIKPVQRICKYPLLFDELYSVTLESDSVESHQELKKVLGDLQKAAERTNRAIDDRGAQARLQRSWRLQDLLVLPDVAISPASLRLLGQPILCGVLYVAYEFGQDICGNYMLCVLFSSYLLLAVQQPDSDRFDVIALINLDGSQLGKADDGRGLRCHTAPFSWKLVFESAQHLYELIFCACSLREEEAWTGAITQQTQNSIQATQELSPAPHYDFLKLNVSPLGPVFGIFGSVTRRLSVQRAATVHSRVNGPQVIIRNTTTAKFNKTGPEWMYDSIGRSKSVTAASHVPILAPKRADRSRMESALADVWSRDQLPFPGMSSNRDHAIRASASSMMRRISRASISSSFSKKSASTTSFTSLKPATSAPDLQKIGEGDDGDERDPRLDAYESLYSTPKQDFGIEEKIGGSPGWPVRAGMVKGVKLSDATNQVREREIPRFSGQSVRIESTEQGSPRMLRNRRSVPGGLLKGFSTEGLKAWRS